MIETIPLAITFIIIGAFSYGIISSLIRSYSYKTNEREDKITALLNNNIKLNKEIKSLEQKTDRLENNIERLLPIVDVHRDYISSNTAKLNKNSENMKELYEKYEGLDNNVSTLFQEAKSIDSTFENIFNDIDTLFNITDNMDVHKTKKELQNEIDNLHIKLNKHIIE